MGPIGQHFPTVDNCAYTLAREPSFAHHDAGDSMMSHGTERAARLFDDQPDMFGEERPPAYRPDPDKVRRRLNKILAELRAAHTVPLKPTRVSLYRTIFPQMMLFLPDEEGAQFRFEFEAELKRLEAS
jgi:hypothetical protein